MCLHSANTNKAEPKPISFTTLRKYAAACSQIPKSLSLMHRHIWVIKWSVCDTAYVYPVYHLHNSILYVWCANVKVSYSDVAPVCVCVCV